MALPLKSGLDLYNNEALRMRLHNLGADPTSDFGVGQVYFNTSTSEGSGKRVRIYDGSAFRSLAYFDEIDNRLKLLEGEIDTDAIISNMKEVSAFLAGFAEDASLMDVLNGKLDKTGGKIKNGATTAPLNIDSDGASTRIGFYKSGTLMGYFAFGETNVPNFTDTNGGRYSLLHSGNVGEYKAGDSDKLGGVSEAEYARYSTKIYTTYTRYIGYGTSDAGFPQNGGVVVAGVAGYSMLLHGRNGVFRFNTVENGSLTGWKTIAFTDSDITGNAASASKVMLNYSYKQNVEYPLVFTSRDNIGVAQNGSVYIDYFGMPTYNTSTETLTVPNLKLQTPRTIWGQSFDGTGNVSGALSGVTNINSALYLNSSGNVTIGDSDLAGTAAKLFVDGGISAFEKFNFTREGWNYITAPATSGNIAFNIGIAGTDRTKMCVLNNGNVGIGTTKPTEKLHVVGNLYVTGNIIADGEVSAGGAGEEGDAGTGTGGGDALIYSQEFTPTTTSITITHNLSATKGVIVQVWEKNGNYWDMVLVDVEEVDTNTVTLFFGKTETTVHKVVIMG